MWRTILIICLLSTTPWHGVHADGGTPASVPPAGEKRLALVVGNGDYSGRPLANPARDAHAMRQALRALGFDVVFAVDADAAALRRSVDDFGRLLAEGGTAFVYFSGHGYQAGGATYLAPVDDGAARSSPAAPRGFDLQELIDLLARPRAGQQNFVVLDTCLSAPFAGAPAPLPSVPARSLVATATGPGAAAGDGRLHGLFSGEVLRALAAPQGDLRLAVEQAARAVTEATAGRQTPLLVWSGAPNLTWRGATPIAAPSWPPVVVALDSRGILPKDSAEQYELTFWESIKDSQHPEDYEAYLKSYPKGRFAALARARIDRLRAQAAKMGSAPPAAAPAAPKPAPAPAVKAPEKPAAPAAKPDPAPPPPPPAAAKTNEKPAAGVAALQDCPQCPPMVSLPKGAFTMGSNTSDPSEKPAHAVTLKEPFAIGKTEVTVEQWNACVDGGGCPRIATDANANAAKAAPVRDVSWDDAQQYVQWLKKVTGKPYRLPTEAEWEYAARGGTTSRYWWGEQMRQGNANCKECGQPWRQEAPATVASFAANPYGLHDVNGSVWEWVSDCWHSSYKGAPEDGRAWDEPACRVRVIRGGSWREGASYMLSTTRFKYDASVRHSQNGFRIARDMK